MTQPPSRAEGLQNRAGLTQAVTPGLRRLANALLKDAVAILRRGPVSSPKHDPQSDQRRRRDIALWVLALPPLPPAPLHICSFIAVCEILDFDPDAIRDQLDKTYDLDALATVSLRRRGQHKEPRDARRRPNAKRRRARPDARRRRRR